MTYTIQETESLIAGLRATIKQCEKRIEGLLEEMANEEYE